MSDKYDIQEAAERTGVDEQDIAEIMVDMSKEGWFFCKHVMWPEDHYMSEYNDL